MSEEVVVGCGEKELFRACPNCRHNYGDEGCEAARKALAAPVIRREVKDVKGASAELTSTI